jgi:hypothetical protein
VTKKPVGTTHPVTKKHGGSGAGSTVTIIPTGAPATGEGGTAGAGSSPLGLIGLGAVAISIGAASMALRTRRRQ